MSVLTTIYKHQAGGAGMRFRQLACALIERGEEIHALSVEPLPLDDDRAHNYLMWAPYRHRENGLFWAWLLAAAPVRLFLMCLRFRPQQAATFGCFYAALLLPCRLLLGLPIVTFVRADLRQEGQALGKPPVRRLGRELVERIGLSASSRVVTNTATLGRRYRQRYGLRPERLHVLYNNLPPAPVWAKGERETLRRSLGLAEDEFAVVSVALLSPLKNMGFLIEAFARVTSPRVRLVIVGDDPGKGQTGERARLEALARRLNLGQRVIFTGWRHDAAKVAGACDLFAMPTRSEGFPNALLEAMSCGLPVLGSDIEELREVLANDELLFRLTDAEGLASKMERAATDPAYRSRLAELSRERARRYDFDWAERACALVLEAGQAQR